MTWILPRSITFPSAQDTAASISDCDEQSQVCARSLLLRSKVSPARTWSLKWKRDSWTQHLSGRILRHSHTESFEDWWTSCLAATRASHSAPQDNDEAKTTHDISGRGLQMELLPCDQPSASLKTSKDISAWGCPTSLKTWQEWVTEQRGAYLARLRSARLTSESAFSSWPTVTASEDSYRIGGTSQQSKCLSAMARPGEMCGPAAQASLSSTGSHLESWQTPEAKNSTGYHKQHDGTKVLKLGSQVTVWATPQTRDFRSGDPERFSNPERSRNLNDQMPTQNGKLNPRWVETLMGLPVGWVMPSCSHPQTIAPTSCACLETESSQLQQNEPSEF